VSPAEIEQRRTAALEDVHEWIEANQNIAEQTETHGIGLRVVNVGGGMLLLVATATNRAIRPRFKAAIEAQFGVDTPIRFEP
jgi:hypothetical protein